jgi:CheY-like chemotaxis protein
MTMNKDLSKMQQRGETSILVAERGPAARESLSELFRDEGYQVLEAPDSASAINHIDNNEGLHVILTDLDMPAWHSIIRHARAVVPNAFILCMVGCASNYDVTEAQRLGAHSHFLKPLEFVDLHQSIQNLVAGKPLR